MSGNRARVLVVDYDQESLIGLERLLEDEGFDTTHSVGLERPR